MISKNLTNAFSTEKIGQCIISFHSFLSFPLCASFSDDGEQMPSLNIHRIDLTLYSPQQVYSLEGEADT